MVGGAVALSATPDLSRAEALNHVLSPALSSSTVLRINSAEGASEGVVKGQPKESVRGRLGNWPS